MMPALGPWAFIKVMGQSSSEIFATKNGVVYFSPTVYALSKLTRATRSY